MNEKTAYITYKKNPVLLDRVLQDMQKVLTEKLKWLNCAFGKAYKLIEHRADGNKFVYPAAYNGRGEYISLLPNDNFGNFSWFDMYDPQKITTFTPSKPQYVFSGAIIFWYNLSSIYEDDTVLYTEEIKDEIISVLTTPGAITSAGKFTVNAIYENFENIYRGYSVEKIYSNVTYKDEDLQNLDKQFLMYPYAGLRVEFTLTARELCSVPSYIPPVEPPVEPPIVEEFIYAGGHTTWDDTIQVSNFYEITSVNASEKSISFTVDGYNIVAIICPTNLALTQVLHTGDIEEDLTAEFLENVSIVTYGDKSMKMYQLKFLAGTLDEENFVITFN